jgi:peptide deformylase
MILPIIAYGDAILKKKSKEIDKDYPKLDQLIEDMFETMTQAHGVGLAAPQVGLSIRLFIVDASPFGEGEDADPDCIGFKRIFINPIIFDEAGDEWGFEEGCLSIPHIREEIMRKSDLKIEYYNEKWELVEESLTSLPARVVQHEYDHIEGILFTDHLNPLKRTLLKGRLNDISKGNVETDYRMKFPKKKK